MQNMDDKGFFTTVVKCIQDTWKKTQDNTKIVIVPQKISVELDLQYDLKMDFKGPMPTKPFLTEVPTPFPTPYGIQFIPVLNYVVPTDQNPSHLQFFPVPASVSVSSNDSKSPESQKVVLTSDNYARAEDPNRKIISKAQAIRHMSEENVPKIKHEITKSSSMPSSMESISKEVQPSTPSTFKEISTIPNFNEKDLSNILNQGIVYFRIVNEKIRKALAQIKKTKKRNLGKLTKQLKELKIDNSEFVKSLHRIQMESIRLSENDVDQNPEFKLLKELSGKIIHNYDQLAFDKLKEYFPGENIDLRQEHFLCSILGLNLSVADCLVAMNPEIRCHQDDKYWIIKYLENNEPTSYGDDIRADFTTMGFTDERAEYLALRLKDHPIKSHMSILDWAIRYIEELFKYDALLNQCYGNYPLNGKFGEWQVIRTKDEDENTNREEKSSNAIKGIMLSSSNELHNLEVQPYLIDQGLELQGKN